MDAKDDLKVDNQAFAVLDVTQRANLLLVTEENIFLESALTTDRITKYADVKITKPEYLESEDYKKEAADGTYDLVIFDECAPATKQLMPLSNTAFFSVNCHQPRTPSPQRASSQRTIPRPRPTGVIGAPKARSRGPGCDRS